MADDATTAIPDLLHEVGVLLDGPRVSAPTRAALLDRMAEAHDRTERFLDPPAFALLVAIVGILLPGDSPVSAEHVALGIDAKLSTGQGDGWRYDALPPDAEAYRTGLGLLADELERQDDRSIDALLERRGVTILELLQTSGSTGPFAASRWYEELLVAVTEAHVAHPATQLAMGCDAFADVPPDATPVPPIHTRRTVVPEQDEVDGVIIGTGAGGAPLLWRLARAGFSVIALEAGRHWDAARDFATDEVAQDKLFWKDERLSAGNDPLGFGNNNSGIGVGGSTLHFTAYTPRPHPDDFRLASESGVGMDWPIGYADLAPYLDEVERILGVSGPADYPWGAAHPAYPLPPLPLNRPALLMQKGCDALGIRTSPAPNAALSRAWRSLGLPERHACTQRGFCQVGCSTGAKGSMDVSFIPAALAAGAGLRTEAFATGIERDGSGRVRAVVYHEGGVEKRQRCRNLFLCGGAIETPRLLLTNDGLGNASGEVGRNFMAHPGLQLWGFFDEPTRPWRGIPGGLISEDTHRPKGADFAGGYLLQSIGVMPVTYASQLARSGRDLHGDALGRHLRRFDHVAGINILGECLPSPSNHLELSDERDARGLLKPRIHFSAGVNEQRLVRHADATMRSIWAAAGATDTWSYSRFAHVIGTCRMGNDPRTSVVDADCRSHEVPGLHICDNSVFPSALAVNPALTIMALSLRVADRFIARQRTE